MDITKFTKELIIEVQKLKTKYSDLASLTFIDFYCQCREGCDYLFPPSIKENVRIMDILNWFCQCVENRSYTVLFQLMSKDIIGPTLAEFKRDEEIEKRLKSAFSSAELKISILEWDCQRQSDGNVNLILRNLLTDLSAIEFQQQQKSTQN